MAEGHAPSGALLQQRLVGSYRHHETAQNARAISLAQEGNGPSVAAFGTVSLWHGLMTATPFCR